MVHGVCTSCAWRVHGVRLVLGASGEQPTQQPVAASGHEHVRRLVRAAEAQRTAEEPLHVHGQLAAPLAEVAAHGEGLLQRQHLLRVRGRGEG